VSVSFVRLLCSSFDPNSSTRPFRTKNKLSLDARTSDKLVEAEVGKIIKQKQKFERLVVTKEELLRLFEGNPFKEQIISTKVPDGSRSTVYRCGDLVDLCRGPHLPNTGRIKAFAATRHSATNWLGDTDNDSLQRMYAISFPDKKMLKVWMENQEKVSSMDFIYYVAGAEG
jgi:threonyl-tRNA synthetase